MKPLHCGAPDVHEPHEWADRQFTAKFRVEKFTCTGQPLSGGGHWVQWDLADDLAEDRADRTRRDTAA